MRYFAYLFWLFIIFVGIIFAALNSHTIRVNYYFSQIDLYLPLLIVVLLLVGALLGAMAMLPALMKAKNATRKMKHKIKQTEQEIKNLRAIPLKDAH